MKYNETAASLLSVGLLFLSTAYSQMNVSNFSSWATRTGQSVPTYIDSLCIDTKAANGLAVTRVTMTVTPGGYLPYYYYNSTYSPAAETPVDSIEMSLSFRLPTDFVADSMWLWVNGEPQEAYIQDRDLAASQYQQIVGRRRDPALLQYSGNGYYFLRIFPAASYTGRKIALQFHHTFDEDSAQSETASPLVTAPLPFTFDTAYQYSYLYYGRKRPLAFARLTCRTTDRKEYAVTIPGLGSGVFSHGAPCMLTSRAVFTLGCGAVTCSDPSGSNEYLWTGRDLRSAKTCAGFSAPLRRQELAFLPEPSVRIIVLDVRTSSWDWKDYYRLHAAANGWTYNPSYYSYSTPVDIWNRAQKYALLAIKSYVKDGQEFNVVFSGETPRSVFRLPVPATDANKQAAVAAILSAVPDPAANTLAALQNAAAQADDGIVFLISDLYLPYNYYATGTTYPRRSSATGIAYDSLLSRINTLFRNMPGLTLFTISDDWQLNQIPVLSGGYSLGGLRCTFVLPYELTTADVGEVMNLYLPPLFGSLNRSGFQKVTVSNRDLDDIVFTLETSITYPIIQPIPASPVFITAAPAVASANALSKTADEYPAPSINALLRVAGRASKSEIHKPLHFTVEGKMSGRCFTHKIIAAADRQCHCSAATQNVQWAFRKTEWLYADNWLANAGAIKQTGREYHIVTRQTSLLALEPGMTLWPDTVSSTTAQTASNGSGTAMRMESASFMAMPSSTSPYDSYGYAPATGITVDSVPLEDVLEGGTAVFPDGRRSPSVSSIRSGIVSIKGSTITLQLPPALSGTVTIALYDLNGRRLACRTIDPARSGGDRLTWNLNDGKVYAKGNYLLRVTGAGYNNMFRIPLLGR